MERSTQSRFTVVGKKILMYSCFLLQALELVRLGLMFPIYCIAYMLAPTSSSGVFMKNPFVKFICHSASFLCFLMLLACASQRVERITMQVSKSYIWGQFFFKVAQYLLQVKIIYSKRAANFDKCKISTSVLTLLI